MEINEMKSRKTIEKITKPKEKNQILKIRNEREDFTTNTTERKRISKEHYEQP